MRLDRERGEVGQTERGLRLYSMTFGREKREARLVSQIWAYTFLSLHNLLICKSTVESLRFYKN